MVIMLGSLSKYKAITLSGSSQIFFNIHGSGPGKRPVDRKRQMVMSFIICMTACMIWGVESCPRMSGIWQRVEVWRID